MLSDEQLDRWMSQQPVEGCAFLYNDPVAVIAGPRAGARGAVVGVLALDGERRYRVEVGDGTEIEAVESDLVGADAESTAHALALLQRWYSSECDGDWEHGLGIKIETLDNPGWMVKIDLTGTRLEGRSFSEINDTSVARNWISCQVRDKQFEGYGGPHMLGRIIRAFVDWATSTSPP